MKNIKLTYLIIDNWWGSQSHSMVLWNKVKVSLISKSWKLWHLGKHEGKITEIKVSKGLSRYACRLIEVPFVSCLALIRLHIYNLCCQFCSQEKWNLSSAVVNGQVGDNEYISTVTEAAKIILDMDWHKDFIWRSMMNLNFCDPDYLVILKCSIRLSKSTEFLFFWNRVFTRDSLIGQISVSPVKMVKK